MHRRVHADRRVSEARAILASGARRNQRDVLEEQIVLTQPRAASQK